MAKPPKPTGVATVEQYVVIYGSLHKNSNLNSSITAAGSFATQADAQARADGLIADPRSGVDSAHVFHAVYANFKASNQ